MTKIRRDRGAEFAARGTSAREVEERWRKLRGHLTRAMAELSQSRLEEQVRHPRHGPITGREVLLVVARHCAEHLGQAELTRDLLEASGEGHR